MTRHKPQGPKSGSSKKSDAKPKKKQEARDVEESIPAAEELFPLPLYSRVAGNAPLALGGTEWLLTNSLGGFAMGSALGAPLRRYHGLLVTDTPDSAQRRVMLNSMSERIIIRGADGKDEAHELSCFRFASDEQAGIIHPDGHTRLVRFEKDVVCCWTFRAGPVEVTKELLVPKRTRSAVVRYGVRAVRGGGADVRLELRPLVSMRDYHSLLRAEGAEDRFRIETDGAAAGRAARVHADGCTLRLSTDTGSFRPNLEAKDLWWYNFLYLAERARGQDHVEDLFCPGVFEVDLSARKAKQFVVFQASADPRDGVGPYENELDRLRRTAHTLVGSVMKRFSNVGEADVEPLLALALASDDFVVHPSHIAGGRGSRGGVRGAASIIAGYPWFTDWGRDTMISLPGLMLETGRFPEALGALRRFAEARRNGIIPNRFTDVGAQHAGHAGATGLGEPEFNTIDASLWFVIASCRYLEASRDRGGFNEWLLPACLDVVEAYRRGTDFGIAMDPADFLVSGGGPGTQLTWMDARRDGVCFTPRHGKAVEINALWHCGLRMLASAVNFTDAVRAADLRSLADAAGASFSKSFFDEAMGCCFDVIARDEHGDWRGVREIRPNQIFAVSLPHSALTPQQQAAVVRTVREKLYTPFGLRTLAPGSPGYVSRFRGSLRELDAAYHNGTAWPWLLGAYAEAVARAGRFSPEAVREAREALRPILRKLDAECVGQIAEVFDAEGTDAEPQLAGGCPAQAWSVAETLRVFGMLIRGKA